MHINARCKTNTKTPQKQTEAQAAISSLSLPLGASVVLLFYTQVSRPAGSVASINMRTQIRNNNNPFGTRRVPEVKIA